MTESTPRGPEELAEIYRKSPESYREEAQIVGADRRTWERFSCAMGLGDVESTVARLVGPGDWVVKLTKADGKIGEQAMVRTGRDLRPADKRGETTPPATSAAMPGFAAEAFQLFQSQAAMDRAHRDVADADRRARDAEARAAQLQIELSSTRSELVDAKQRGFEKGWESGETHGRKVERELGGAKGSDGLGADLKDAAEILAGFIRPAAAAAIAAPAAEPAAAVTRPQKFQRVIGLAVELGTGFEAAAYQIAELYELGQPSDLLDPTIRRTIFDELTAEPETMRWLGANAAAREYVEGFQNWLNDLDAAAAAEPVEPAEVLDPEPEPDTSATMPSDSNKLQARKTA